MRKKKENVQKVVKGQEIKARETNGYCNCIRNDQCMRHKKNLQTFLEKEVIIDKQKKRILASHKPTPLGFAVLPKLLVLNSDQIQFHTPRNHGK